MDFPNIGPTPGMTVHKAEIIVGKPLVPERRRIEYELSRKTTETDSQESQRPAEADSAG